ncbi:MAG: CocE/NonD family hydrolase [Alphaproteobacteria bacterium]
MAVIDQFPEPVVEEANAEIPLSDGTHLAARLWRPADSMVKPVPVILEYLPYRKRDGTAIRDDQTHPYIAGHGYACIRVDMRGAGESEGVMQDEYLPQEQDDCLEVLRWIADQPWSNGRVGMVGISWGGFNGLQVAMRRPPELQAVVSIASTADRYADDIHYKGGCLLINNFAWSAQMMSYMSRPPDPALFGSNWKDIWLSRLADQPHLAETWLDHQHRDDYWKHGSVCEDWSAIQCPVLIVGGLADGYMNAVMELLENQTAPVKGILGPWVHLYPHLAKPEPRIGFLQEMLRWWDRWLKDRPTGADKDPALRAYFREGTRPAPALSEMPGEWRAVDSWPIPDQTIKELHFSATGLHDSKQPQETVSHVSDQDIGVFSGEYFAWIGPDQPNDQRLEDIKSLSFTSAVLDGETRILGRPVVRLRLKVDKPQAQLAIRLNDVNPDGTVMRVSYQTINLSHRNSREAPEPMPAGEFIDIDVPLNNTAHRFLPGHRIRIAVSTAYWPLIWPTPDLVELTLDTDGCGLSLPLAENHDLRDHVFEEPVSAPPTHLKSHRRGGMSRDVTYEQHTGRTIVALEYDTGDYEYADFGLTVGSVRRERYEIAANDPLSALMETHWTQTLARDYAGQPWRIRTEAYGRLTSDAEFFYLSARLEAFDDDKVVFERSWRKTIPRRCV